MGLLLFILIAWGTPAALQAQRPRASVLFYEAQAAPTVEERGQGGILGDGSNDHRYTGMWVGLGVGVGATLLGAAFCSDPDTACRPGQPWAGAVVAIPILGVTGALIGGLFPKTPPPAGGP